MKESLGKIREAASEMITEIEAKLAEMEKAPELAAIPEVMPEKTGKGSHSRTHQESGKDQEKNSVLKDLTAKKTGPDRKGHGRKKPVRSEESR